MGCCQHDHNEEKKAEGGCCGGHHHHHHDHAPKTEGLKWWQKLIPGLQKKSCCGSKQGHH